MQVIRVDKDKPDENTPVSKVNLDFANSRAKDFVVEERFHFTYKKYQSFFWANIILIELYNTLGRGLALTRKK